MSDLTPRWNCPFTYLSLGLSGCYLAILLVVLRLHHQLLTRHQERWAQKLFLSIAALHCTLRCIFFGMWPCIINLSDDPCGPSVSDKQSNYPWLDTLGLVPVALFLSTFSVNVIFFARVYHILLGQRSWCYRYLLSGLSLINAAVYILTFTDVATDPSEMLSMLLEYTLIFSTIFIAAGFVIYSVLIHWIVTKMTHAKGGGVSLQGPPSSNSTHISKMVRCSCLCLLCFLVRAATIPIGDQFTDGGIVAGIYSFISEVIPLAVMLVLFEADHDAKFAAPKPVNRHHALAPRTVGPKTPFLIDLPHKPEVSDNDFDVGSMDTDVDSANMRAPFTPMNLPFTPIQNNLLKEHGGDSPMRKPRGKIQIFTGASPRNRDSFDATRASFDGLPRASSFVDRRDSSDGPRTPNQGVVPRIMNSPASESDFESYSQLKDQPLFLQTNR